MSYFATRKQHLSFQNDDADGSKSEPRERTHGVPRLKSELPGPPVEPTPREGPSPVSFGQQLLWFFEQMFPQSPTYNEPIMVQMAGPVDAVVLARCLTEITRRHEAWRTVFTPVDGRPAQQIKPPCPFQLSVIDLTSLPSDQREPEALRLSADDARRPFDLEHGPLVRASLIRLTEADSRLIVTAHHIVVDGVSFFSIFLPELHTLYVAFSNGEPSPLPELPVQYADFAAWQRRWLTEEELAPKLAYWRTHMAGLTELCLPTDHPRPSQPSAHGARAPVLLSPELMKGLRGLGRRASATLFTTLLAAWKTLLFRYTGQSDIVVGSAAAGRPRPEFDRVIGYFNNNLVLRTQLDASLTFVELVSRVHAVLKAAREHQDVPFDRLIAELKVERSLNKSPLYDNVFILMPPLSPLSEPPQWSANRFDIRTAKVDLYLELHQRPSGLVGHIEYATELFSAATIERMIGHFQALVEGVVRDPEQRLSELPLLTAAEEQKLAVWQRPLVAPPPDSEVASLEQLFEAQAARSPEAFAVAHGGQRLTYEQLNTRVNQLAHYLRFQGVGPDTLVGLCVERSFDAMVGILGVLKAGGAYVPLDPAYPSERLRFMLEDADIQLLLTNKKNASVARQHRGRAVLLDEDWPVIAQHSANNPAPIATAEHLAYVIYTSGSTGQPKGVLVERRGLYYLAKAQERMFGLGVGSRVLSFFSINFDGSVWDFTMSWPVGATLVLANQEVLLPGPSLVQLLKEEDIHAVMVTPSALMVTPYQELPGLHTLITAGEALPAELVERWAPGRRLFNVYGPTETTVVSIVAQCRSGEGKPPIGRPLEHVPVYILDSAMHAVPVGVPGELYIGGPGVARGYLNRPDLSASRFVDSPFPETAATRFYKTGDRVQWRPDGSIDYLGRADRQIKLRGFRIELGEVEAVLTSHPAVQQAVATVWERGASDRLLLAHVSLREELGGDASAELVAWLRQRLPSAMVPAAVLRVDKVPLLPSGKVNYHALPAPSALSSVASAAYHAPSSDIERRLTRIWQDVLQRDTIGVHDNFFDVGGHSLLLATVQRRITTELGREIPIVVLYKYPTVSSLASYLEEVGAGGSRLRASQTDSEHLTARRERGQRMVQTSSAPLGVAIIGMSGRFPGAGSIEEFWNNLCAGVESITFYSRRELLLAGVAPAVADDPSYVPANGRLADIALFDADFFGINAREAEITDPQHRLLLECGWEALEDAGYEPRRYPGAIGVFVGSASEQYLYQHVHAHPEVREIFGDYYLNLANSRDFLATRIAYKLDLKGPSLTIQTACSTSLVTVTAACQSLLDHQCDIALAGGVSLNLAWRHGYVYRQGMMSSPDGRCRAFDASANGIVGGDGVGLVALKRLEDALADGDSIYAVIKGAALTNDGAGKVGYAAPSVQGQSQAIAQALGMAGFEPGSVTYVETHGTGTQLGDSIEIAALTEVFHRPGAPNNSCALGAVKTNIGHLDAAAGIAGLIKAALCVHHQKLPPTLHYERPNPNIDLPNSPFYVNTRLIDWSPPGPRRAGVSAFGIGGTNAHVVLEEAPVAPRVPSRRAAEILVLSARTPAALDAISANLATHLHQHREHELADVAYTLQIGRRAFAHRRAVLCRDREEALRALTSTDSPLVLSRGPVPEQRAVVFLFSGQGSQFVDMGLSIYESEPTFRAWVDRCAELLRPHLGADLRQILYPSGEEAERAAGQLCQTAFAQPALFVLEYALAKLWMEWGVQPEAMLGHSIGEYVAACLAGVFDLPDALWLVAQRGRLMQGVPAGAMLAVALPEAEARARCGDTLALAAVNGPELAVIAGPISAVEALQQQLTGDGVHASRLHTSHAFHSQMVEPILPAFERCVAEVSLRAPKIPYLSNVTGGWADPTEVTSAVYWVRHLRETVRFSDGLLALFQEPSRVLLEVGPGEALAAMVARHPQRPEGQRLCTTLPQRRDGQLPEVALLAALEALWLSGVEIDWRGYYAHEHRGRVSLPTYPFERQHYWLEPPRAAKVDVKASVTPAPEANRDPAGWLYKPVWRVSPWPTHAPSPRDSAKRRFLVFADGGDIATSAVSTLRGRGEDVTIVRPGALFSESPEEGFTLQPGSAEHYRLLVQRLATSGRLPGDVLHLWSVGSSGAKDLSLDHLAEQQERGFYSLVFLVQALGREATRMPVRIAVVTAGTWSVAGEPVTRPEQATVLGPCLVIPQEYDSISCRCIDLCDVHADAPGFDPAPRLLSELDTPEGEALVAYRRGRRFHRTFERVPSGDSQRAQVLLRPHGVYLITGGLGGIGLSLAKYLAHAARARLVLTTREPFPERHEWAELSLAGAEGRDAVASERVERIRHLQEIEALGAEILVVQADVTSHQQMFACVREAHARFGEIHGVIHTAGLSGGGALAGKTTAQAARTLAPKVQGTLVLNAVFGDQDLDFFVLCSSLASIMGSFGQADYSAANAFQDSFAHYQRRRSKALITSINWEGWKEVGMGRHVGGSHEVALSPKEGAEVFALSLASDLAQVIISTLDLAARLQGAYRRATAAPVRASPAHGPAHAHPPRKRGYLAPESDLERRMAEIWVRFFGVKEISANDDFFDDFGGDSLMAVHLLALMNSELELGLAVNSLLAAPTIAALAASVDVHAGTSARARVPAQSSQLAPLIELKRSTSPCALFLVHPVGGHVYIYRDLVSLLDDDRPVYALQARGLDGKIEPLRSIREMATQYVAVIRARQPEGPYQLGGASFGGMVAYEMARLLLEQGQEVDFIAMIDTAGPGDLLSPFESDAEILAYMLQIGALNSALAAKLRELPPEERLHRFIQHTGERSRLIPPLPPEQVRHFFKLWRIGIKAMSEYTPAPARCPIVFFRASERDTVNPSNPELAWRKLAVGSFELYDVPGNHITMNYAPHAKRIADVLTTYMARKRPGKQ
jgi:amino acid adenylation domain-containing protein